MTDESPEDEEVADNGSETDADEEKSFRERVEEMREKRSEREEGEEREELSREEKMKEMMGGGGGPGGPGGMGGGGGGNPFAQMMSGMMGGGPGGPGGMGSPGGREQEGGDNERVVRELTQLRDEVRDVTRQLQRIADALESDD